MPQISLRINDALNTEFRNAVHTVKGMKKGNLTEAMEEAMQQWIEDNLHDCKKCARQESDACFHCRHYEGHDCSFEE